MTKESVAQNFWRKSTQLRRGGLTPTEQEKFRLFVIQPAINTSNDPDERRLLSKLG
jgi:hypothetical protein